MYAPGSGDDDCELAIEWLPPYRGSSLLDPPAVVVAAVALARLVLLGLQDASEFAVRFRLALRGL